MVRCITRVAVPGSLRPSQVVAERETKIQNEVKEINRVFYCELCNKQYKLATEFETHLSSYDHNHKKVLWLQCFVITAFFLLPVFVMALCPVGTDSFSGQSHFIYTGLERGPKFLSIYLLELLNITICN